MRKAHGNILPEEGNDSRATSQAYVKPPTDSGNKDPVATDADAEMTDAGELAEAGSASGSGSRALGQKLLTFVFSDGAG